MALLSQIPERKTNGQRRNADETVQVTEHLQVSQWTRQDAQGRTWYNCKIERVNPRNRAEPYKTFLPSHLLEFPEALATLASACANAPELPDDLKGSVARFADIMMQAKESLEANGQRGEANGKSESRVLTF